MIDTANSDLHTHTNYSDGRGRLEENVRAAEAAGLDAVAISDHLLPLGDEEHSVRRALPERNAALAQMRSWAGLRVISAVEGTAVDLRGTLSYREEDLCDTELVLVDVGYRTCGLACDVPIGKDRQMGATLDLYLRLASSPLVDVLAHPFTLGRFPLDVTLDDVPGSALVELGETLAANGAAFEINNGVWWWWPQQHPGHLATSYARVVAAVAEGGARFTIGSDAHCNTGVGNLGWARHVADLAGIGGSDWANVEELLQRRHYRTYVG